MDACNINFSFLLLVYFWSIGYTKERQLLDEVKFMYEKKMQDDLTLEEMNFMCL